jgi:hypothetical protein
MNKLPLENPILSTISPSVTQGNPMDANESLLRAIFATIGRSTFPPKEVYRLITPHGGSEKKVAAYNLCDGKTSQAAICAKAKITKSQLSESITSWVSAGIVVRFGPDQLPLHVYPLSKENLKAAKAAEK